MMMVETELRPSGLHGIGVFLKRPVAKGGLIWRFDSRIDRVFSEWELQALPAHVRDFLRTYSTFHAASRLFVLCGDDGRFFNHSERPSTISDSSSFGDDRAATDLDAGSELTADYRAICDQVCAEGLDFRVRVGAT